MIRRLAFTSIVFIMMMQVSLASSETNFQLMVDEDPPHNSSQHNSPPQGVFHVAMDVSPRRPPPTWMETLSGYGRSCMNSCVAGCQTFVSDCSFARQPKFYMAFGILVSFVAALESSKHCPKDSFFADSTCKVIDSFFVGGLVTAGIGPVYIFVKNCYQDVHDWCMRNPAPPPVLPAPPLLALGDVSTAPPSPHGSHQGDFEELRSGSLSPSSVASEPISLNAVTQPSDNHTP